MNLVPHAFGPEKSVLSSMMKSRACRARAAAGGIGEEHFHVPSHRVLWRVLRDHDVKENGAEVDLVSLVDAMSISGDLLAMGGPGGLAEIYTYAPHDAHFERHETLLREALARRTAMLHALKIAEDAAGAAPEDLTKALSDALAVTAGALKAGSPMVTAAQAVERLALRLQELAGADAQVPGLATGLGPIDRLTGGMWPVELWVVAAHTSGGKSVVLLQAALTALQEGKRVFVVSLEMQAEDLAGRMIANLKSIPAGTWRQPKLAHKDILIRARQGMEELREMKLTIDDQGGRTVEQIAALAQAEIDRHGKLDLIVVDYIQRIESRRQKDQTRAQELGDISKRLKSMAMKLRVPVMTASQVNDGGQLFDSRAIGHDADVVLIVEKEGFIRGDKVRNGERDQHFPLRLDGRYQRFVEWEGEREAKH
ncbi:replicative DNA helicase [Luteolibacter sp. Populi]|uniref:replicative DNA helicase n=1 Tax=Luteolibacter sp. Populi TaxID=3230487 RepID=UPI003466CCE5